MQIDVRPCYYSEIVVTGELYLSKEIRAVNDHLMSHPVLNFHPIIG